MLIRTALAAVTATLSLSLSSPAQAQIELDPRGTGQALYIPYYTVEDEHSTLLSISNTSSQAKALRINFVEALNGQRVLSFNVYLSPNDTWNAAVDAADATAPARVRSFDASCTYPALAAEGQPFRAFAYAETYPDGGPADLARTRSGSIEIIEMGVPGGELGTAVAQFDCEALTDAFAEGGAWRTDANAGVGAPSGGLTASAEIVLVADGVVYNLPASAIDGFAGRAHHSAPASEFPRISNPVPAVDGDDFSVRVPGVGTFPVDGERGPDAISALFMAERLLGDYHGEEAIGGSTHWLVAFPTRHAYVFDTPGSLVDDDGPAVAPFTAVFAGGSGCESVRSRRNDLDGEDFADFITPPPPPTELCAQAQLVAVRSEGAGGAVLPVTSETGRAELLLGNDRPPLVLGDGTALGGLPVVGFRLSRYDIGDGAGGIVESYTVSQPLASTPPVVVSGD